MSIDPLSGAIDRGDDTRDAREAERVRFDGNDDPVARDQGSERQVAQGRGRVDEDEVPIVRQADEGANDRKPGLVSAGFAGRNQTGLVGMRSTPGAVDFTTNRESGIATCSRYSTSPMDASPPPSHSVADPWGSRSTTRTRRPRSAKAAARLTVVVVLPLPPLLLDSAILRISAIALDTPDQAVEEVVRTGATLLGVRRRSGAGRPTRGGSWSGRRVLGCGLFCGGGMQLDGFAPRCGNATGCACRTRPGLQARSPA